MAAVVEPCPRCGTGLFLISPLLGCRIRCKSCQAVLDVSRDSLTVRRAGEPEKAAPQRPEPADDQPVRSGWRSWWNRLRVGRPPPVPEASPGAAAAQRAAAPPVAPRPDAVGERIAAKASPPADLAETPAPMPTNGKRPSPPHAEPGPSVGLRPDRSESPRAEPSGPADEFATSDGAAANREAAHEPENLNVPEELSDAEAFGLIEELDASELSSGRQHGWVAEFPSPSRPQNPPGPTSGPAGNGKLAKPGQAAPDSSPQHRPSGRLTPDASAAAARILAPKSFTARRAADAQSAGSPAARLASAGGPGREQKPSVWGKPTESGLSRAGDEERDLEPSLLRPAAGTPDSRGGEELPGTGHLARPAHDESGDGPQPKAAGEPRGMSGLESRAGMAGRSATHHHAQTSPVRFRPAAWGWAAAVLVLLAAGGAGSWWLFSPLGHPQSRYLPPHSSWFLSMDWQVLAQPRFYHASKDSPGLTLARRIEVFTRSAGLAHRDIERVTAGGNLDGTRLIVVYRLTRPVRPEEIADLPNFRDLRKTGGPSERVARSPVYHVGPSAIAFPEPQIIVNGDRDSVVQVLRARTAGIAEPLERLLETADFSTTSLEMSAGLPPEMAAFLQLSGGPADAVIATATNHTYGFNVSFRRTIQLGDAAAAGELKIRVEQAIQNVIADKKTGEPLGNLLKAVSVSQSGDAVQLELELPVDVVPLELLPKLGGLF